MAVVDAALTESLAYAHSRVMFYGTEKLGYTDSGLWEYLPYVYTKDSHDADNPVKPLLADNPDYAKVVFLYMLACKKLNMPKSRQVRMSWFAAAFATWLAKTAPYREIIYQTKKEKDAFSMVSEGSKNPCGGRMDFIEQNLPVWLRDPNIVSGQGNLLGSLVYSPYPVDANGVSVPWHGSKIHALPQGAHQVRQYTFSAMLSDESAFQEEYEKAMIAAQAAAGINAKIISFSSVDSGSGFNQRVLESPDGSDPVQRIHPTVQKALNILKMDWPKGLRTWQTPSGEWVLEVHYTADPSKDPERDGAEWFKEALKGYVGGMDSTGWQTEMEINYGAGGGDPVFPFLTSLAHPVFTPPPDPKKVIKTMNLVLGYDHGMDSPAAAVVWGIDKDANAHAVWELYEPCLNAAAFVEKLKKCPYWKYLRERKCDPKICAKDQMQADGNKSINEQFYELGVHFHPGRRGQDVPMALRFMSTYWKDPMNPRAFITGACPNTQREFMGLKWEKHISDAVSKRKDNPGKIMQKNNHAFDATCYVLDGFSAPWIAKKNTKVSGIRMNDLLELADQRQSEREGHQYGIRVA